VIPQLADAVAVLEAIDVPEGVSRSVLVPNERGLDNALAVRERFDEISVFLSASESHNRANVNCSVQESLAGLERVVPRARAAGLDCEAVISTAFGCPYEGRVDPERVFVPAGATGNVATEDVVWMLHESGVVTCVELAALLACSRAVQSELGRPLGSHLLVAGPVDWHGRH
jgi:hydroxymethylglutaryl-CoA lyase